MGDALAHPKTRKQTLAAVRKALKQVGLPAAISARSKKVKGGGHEIRVVLIVRGQAEPMIEENIAVGKNDKASAQLSPLLAVPLQDLANAPPPAAAAEPEAAAPAEKGSPKKEAKEAKKDDEEEPVPAASTDNKDSGPAKKRGAVTYNNAMVVAEVGAEVADRQMKYNQVLLGALRGYSQPGVASWALGVQIYPAASQNIPVAKDIGIVARYSDSLVFESKTGDGSQTAKGKWTKYAVGVRGRIAVGDKPASPLIGIEGMYGSSKYDFAGTDQVVLELPSVNYTFIRAGADARVPFGPAALTVGAGYINVMSGGKLGDLFPKAKFSGVDAKIGVSYAFISWLEARALFTYTRIGMKANPDVTSDPFIAGGAIDQYFVGNIGISALF